MHDIEARAPQRPNPTKDQMRLMLQSLLADRFKIQVHTETRQIPIFVMTLEKAGKLGPQLVPHTDNPPCAAPGPSGQDGWPVPVCGALLTGRPTEGRWRIAYRDASMHLIADALPAISMQALDRPVLDQTGLSGTFDFRIEFAPQRVPLLNGTPFPNFTPNEEGPTFREALQEQLGLKLEDHKLGRRLCLVIRSHRATFAQLKFCMRDDAKWRRLFLATACLAALALFVVARHADRATATRPSASSAVAWYAAVAD